MNPRVSKDEPSGGSHSAEDVHCVHCGKVRPPSGAVGEILGCLFLVWTLGFCFPLGVWIFIGIFLIIALLVWHVYFSRRCPRCEQWQSYRAVRRWRQGRCVACGYDLTGNASGKCSECGRAIPASGQV